MSTSNRTKLTNLVSKLPEEAVNNLYEAAQRLFAALAQPDKPDCPYCGSAAIVKNGHKCRKQEYRCKCCGKTFVSTTNTLMNGSHQSSEVWEEVIQDTFNGDAIDYTAIRLGLSHDCVFHMRHKVLLALETLKAEEPVVLDDVAELDETFVLDCYKGKSIPQEAGRPARKHGAKAEKRGISNEYVCICAGVQRQGDAIAKTVNRAKPSCEELEAVFDGHISNETLVLCDGLRGYSSLEGSTGCVVKNVNLEKQGSFYHLNNVNSFHSFIKQRYHFYKGVATKYLNRYNMLFSLAYKGAAKATEMVREKFLTVTAANRHISCKDVGTLGLLQL